MGRPFKELYNRANSRAMSAWNTSLRLAHPSKILFTVIRRIKSPEDINQSGSSP